MRSAYGQKCMRDRPAEEVVLSDDGEVTLVLLAEDDEMSKIGDVPIPSAIRMQGRGEATDGPARCARASMRHL